MTENSLPKNVGTKWYKCDLHLHTPASQCFEDKSVSAHQWVEAAIKAELGCVAVTDHNTGEWIDQIKKASEKTSLTIFPGTEITCSDAKVHLLILFDVTATSQTIGDFLIKADIDRKTFGTQDAKTNRSLQSIVELAEKEGALVIAAHIDEFNGICQASHSIQEDFLTLPGLNGVQLVHEALLEKQLKIDSNTELNEAFKTYYGKEIPKEILKSWYKTAQLAEKNGNTILTFSDNPSAPQNPKHGLWGIGQRYTWIKMDQTPSLESLRQALLLPEFRIRNDFAAKQAPYATPEHWLQQVSIQGTRLNTNPLTLDFSPQMTTIIGGPGSGKSTVFRCIRGAFNLVSDLETHPSLKKEQDDFFKTWDKRKKIGILDDKSEISVVVKRAEDTFKILYRTGGSSVAKLNEETKTFEPVADDYDASDFSLEIFSQKQIFSIAQSPEALRDRIDSSTPTILSLKNELEQLRAQFLEKGASIRTLVNKLSNKQKLEREIKELARQIQSYEKSGYGDLTKDKENFSNEQVIINEFEDLISNKIKGLLSCDVEISKVQFETDSIREVHRKELLVIAEAARKSLTAMQTQIVKLKNEASLTLSNFKDSIGKSEWSKASKTNQQELKAKKDILLEQGVKDLENFEALLKAKTKKEQELSELEKLEPQVKDLNASQRDLRKSLLELRDKICTARRDFLGGILVNSNVRMKVSPYRDSEQFIRRLREVIQKESGFEDDIEKIYKKVFTSKSDLVKELDKLISELLAIKPECHCADFGKTFNKVIEGLNGQQLDELQLLLPEDEIFVEYRTTGSKEYKPLSSASPGQKTSAILTFILSYGTSPLLLDQPDDDVASNLIYDLIVERIRETKERRQLIVITHNANIPVNGDSEYIVALDSGSRQMKLGSSGTIEQENIKKEICDVMEGGKEAFDMRSKRYSFN